jgi:hypothetical protein
MVHGDFMLAEHQFVEAWHFVCTPWNLAKISGLANTRFVAECVLADQHDAVTASAVALDQGSSVFKEKRLCVQVRNG